MHRFIEAQENSYFKALEEISHGRKRTHWIWYIFPQMAGLAFSETSKYYAIRDRKEAVEYLKHPVLGQRLIEITIILLNLNENDIFKVFGTPDDMKVKSCMTLFASLPDTHPVFQKVLDKFFSGEKDMKTIALL